MKIGVKYPNLLKYQGLTKREFSGAKNKRRLDMLRQEFPIQREAILAKNSKKGHPVIKCDPCFNRVD